jgi:hypothetical protein
VHHFSIFTVGWEPDFIDRLLAPIQKQTGINFTHGLVGDASRIDHVHKQYSQINFVALSIAKEEQLPSPDYALLARLEGAGVPTVRSMVQGDRVLRNLSERAALGYATLLARRIHDALVREQPDVVLASYDSVHSAISLAVAKSLGIPWVAMAFAVIPDNLTGFCCALTPNSLVPIVRSVDQQMLDRANEIIQSVRAKEQKVVAYRAPASLSQWVRQFHLNAKNLLRRRHDREILGIDRFTYPSKLERLCDVVRRAFNRLCMPTTSMVSTPPDARFIYFPLHMAPESTVDTWAPFYQNQIAFVAQLSLAIPADTCFVIKLHFSDPDNYSRKQLEQLMKLPRLLIAHPNAPGNSFIEKAALVIGIQGTSCLEASLLGKPVLIFGDSPYQHFPRTERAKRPDELYEQISNMLAQPPATDEEIVEAYATYMARYMPGRINDWSNAISEEEMKRYSECFMSLKNYINSLPYKSNWYEAPPFIHRI